MNQSDNDGSDMQASITKKIFKSASEGINLHCCFSN